MQSLKNVFINVQGVLTMSGVVIIWKLCGNEMTGWVDQREGLWSQMIPYWSVLIYTDPHRAFTVPHTLLQAKGQTLGIKTYHTNTNALKDTHSKRTRRIAR